MQKDAAKYRPGICDVFVIEKFSTNLQNSQMHIAIFRKTKTKLTDTPHTTSMTECCFTNNVEILISRANVLA